MSNMTGYENQDKIPYPVSFFNPRGKEEWNWSQSAYETRYSEQTEAGFFCCSGTRCKSAFSGRR